MRQHKTPTHGFNLLSRFDPKDIRYIGTHPREVLALAAAKEKPVNEAKAVSTAMQTRLRAIVRAMGFASPKAMSDALLALEPTIPVHRRPRRARGWSRRKLSPEKQAEIVADIRSTLFTIRELADRHVVSAATISRLKRYAKAMKGEPVEAVHA